MMRRYEFTPILGWSVSRYDTFSSCKRRYYYQYYGRYDTEFGRQRIDRLKSLSSIPLELGNIVHDVIGALLKRLLKSEAAIDKTRPDGDCCDSFPSGHASFTFMGASFLQRRYGWKYGLPAYAAATFVAYSRVEADRHFVEDVVAGAAIGFLSSYYFTTRYPGVSIIPVARRDFAGVTFSMQW